MNALVLAAQQQSGNPLSLLIILVPFGLLIWLMVVPQRKQRARQQQLMSALDVGDEVITAGGIVGVVTHLEDQIVHLEVDHDVVIRVAKSSITRTTAEPDPADAPKKGLLGGLMGGGGASKADTSEDTAVRTRTTPKGSAPTSKRVTPKAGSGGSAKK
ncbi:MAG: preprotein translocase subunit YajC [Microthrixaceae bacterium]